MSKYERAQQVARNVFNSKAFSAEEHQAIEDVTKLERDEVMYVVAWLKGAAIASNMMTDFQHNLK